MATKRPRAVQIDVPDLDRVAAEIAADVMERFTEDWPEIRMTWGEWRALEDRICNSVCWILHGRDQDG